MLQRALLSAFQCVHLSSFPFFLLCFCPSFPYSPHVLHVILVLLVSYISSFPFSFLTYFVVVFPSFLLSFSTFQWFFFFCFSLPSHFLSCALIIFVSLPSLVRASFIPVLFEFDFFFLPCILHLFSQSFRLKVWSVGLILCVSSETFTFYWSMTVAAIFVFHSSFQPGGREALLNLISFGMTLIMRPGNLR